MTLYCDDYRKDVEWKHSLKAREEEKKNNVTVILEKFPESEMVPDKKNSTD